MMAGTLISYTQNHIIVSNTANFPASYTTAQEAHDNAEAGDILLFHGSTTSYGDLWITKPLTIQGPGYFLGENEQQYTNLLPATLGVVNIEDGGEGTTITGMTTSIIFINASDINIDGNNTGAIYVNYGCSNCSTNTLNNIVVQINYINAFFTLYPNATNVILTNNFIAYYNAAGSVKISGNTETLLINNNVIDGSVRVDNAYITNNIILRSGSYITSNYNNIYRNNIAVGDFLTDNGNQEIVDMSTVFVGYPEQGDYSLDARFQLIENIFNPAKGGGINDEDCGMFGGSDIYVLSGSPNIPTIYDIIMPVKSAPNGTIPVEVKARTNN